MAAPDEGPVAARNQRRPAVWALRGRPGPGPRPWQRGGGAGAYREPVRCRRCATRPRGPARHAVASRLCRPSAQAGDGLALSGESHVWKSLGRGARLG